uniref:Uncharacterized protein n=1 Tax=Mycena chlorophos TaxID=658473 RepID=A0ABQ0LTX5_MYCCL|nr:predicted protein [Mycena chlorophos]
MNHTPTSASSCDISSPHPLCAAALASSDDSSSAGGRRCGRDASASEPTSVEFRRRQPLRSRDAQAAGSLSAAAKVPKPVGMGQSGHEAPYDEHLVRHV